MYFNKLRLPVFIFLIACLLIAPVAAEAVNVTFEGVKYDSAEIRGRGWAGIYKLGIGGQIDVDV